MKKLVMVMVFVFITLFFAGFNYLLWERETRNEDIEALKYTNDSNNDTINYLSRQIKALEDDRKILNNQLKEALDSIEIKTLNYESLTANNNKLKDEMAKNERIIESIKSSVIVLVSERLVNIWADYINNGNYTEAYELLEGGMGIFEGQPSEEDLSLLSIKNSYEEFQLIFTDRKPTIEVISIENINLEEEGQEIFVASLNIKVSEPIEKNLLKSGKYHAQFSVSFNATQLKWVITTMAVIKE